MDKNWGIERKCNERWEGLGTGEGAHSVIILKFWRKKIIYISVASRFLQIEHKHHFRKSLVYSLNFLIILSPFFKI